MKFILFSLVGTALLLVSCSKDDKQRQKDSMLILVSQEAVQSKLKDGASAEFRNVGIHKGQKPNLVCGEVNSKNGFGGFSGYQRFISAGTAELTFLEEQMKRGEMDISWDRFCRS